LSRHGKGKAKKVSVAVVLDNLNSIKDMLSDNIPNVPEVVKDIFDKEERLGIIKEGQELSKEEPDLARMFFMNNATLSNP
jgi:hypothetical protein